MTATRQRAPGTARGAERSGAAATAAAGRRERGRGRGSRRQRAGKARGRRPAVPGWERCEGKSFHGEAVPWQHVDRSFQIRYQLSAASPREHSLTEKGEKNPNKTNPPKPKPKPTKRRQTAGAAPPTLTHFRVPVPPLPTRTAPAPPRLRQVPPSPPRLSSGVRHGSPSPRVPHPGPRPARQETRRALRLPGNGSSPRGPPAVRAPPGDPGGVVSQPHPRAPRDSHTPPPPLFRRAPRGALGSTRSPARATRRGWGGRGGRSSPRTERPPRAAGRLAGEAPPPPGRRRGAGQGRLWRRMGRSPPPSRLGR